MNSFTDDIPWIFIPLSADAVLTIWAWIRRLATNKNDDADVTKKCEEIIFNAFLTHKLTYNCDKFGEIRMSELRLLLGSDGICVPEHCFVDPPVTLKRVQESLHPFICDA